jgi:hypothetical protein
MKIICVLDVFASVCLSSRECASCVKNATQIVLCSSGDVFNAKTQPCVRGALTSTTKRIKKMKVSGNGMDVVRFVKRRFRGGPDRVHRQEDVSREAGLEAGIKAVQRGLRSVRQ